MKHTILPGKVTVITPTYDRLESLKEAVDCVRNQSYNNWEHFIVSDGFDTRVRRYVKALGDDRIRYFFTLSTAYAGHLQRNIALKYATGEFVFCLDDDNLIDKDYLSKMAEPLADSAIDYTVCRIKYDGYGDWVKTAPSISDCYMREDGYDILDPKLPFRGGGIDMLNYMIRTEVARKHGGWVPFDNWSADFVLIENVSKTTQGHFIPQVLGWHRNLPRKKVGAKRSRATTKNKAGRSGISNDGSIMREAYFWIAEFLGIKASRKTGVRSNINRLIYSVLCRTWYKF